MQNVKSVPGNDYLVGAFSTAAADFLRNLTSKGQAAVTGKKKSGKDYAFCAAIDPCTNDYFLGFKGLSTSWTIPLDPLPPVTVEAELDSISYAANVSLTHTHTHTHTHTLQCSVLLCFSYTYVRTLLARDVGCLMVVCVCVCMCVCLSVCVFPTHVQGKDTGISQSAVGLWTYNMASTDVPAPVPIPGNLDAVMAVNVSWGYIVNNVKVATISLTGPVETVVKFSNPVAFTLQTSITPTIDIYDGSAFKLDLTKFNGALMTNFLFSAQHTSNTDYNVYAGVQTRANLQQLASALPGLGDTLGKLLDSSSELNTYINVSGVTWWTSRALYVCTMKCSATHRQSDACIHFLPISMHKLSASV